MEQTLKDQIYHAEDIHAKLLKTLESDPKILPENKEAVRKYLNNKAAEGITTVKAEHHLCRASTDSKACAEAYCRLFRAGRTGACGSS